jgi:hypothetical protein
VERLGGRILAVLRQALFIPGNTGGGISTPGSILTEQVSTPSLQSQPPIG